MPLSESIASTYPDRHAGDAAHQADHDTIHNAVNALNAAYDADVAAGFVGTKQAWLEQIGNAASTGVLGIRTSTATADTLVLADAGKVVRYTDAGAVTATVPPNSSVAFEVGTVVNIYSAGAGGVTIAAATGVTVRNNGTALVQYGEASLRKDGTDEWVRVG